MSVTQHDIAEPASRTSTAPRWRTCLAIPAVASGVNLLVWAAARAAGSEFVVRQDGADPMTVGPMTIVVMTVVPLLGLTVLAVWARRSSRAHPVLGWIGLAIGVFTMPMPFSVHADISTQVALASMHLVTGVVWWLGVRRSATERAMNALTTPEVLFLRAQVRSLARIATVAADGSPRVVPGGWAWAEETGEILLTGRDVPATARAAHVRRSGVAAACIDGIHDTGGWAPWALLASGPAVVDEAAGVIRLRPTWNRSWGLEPFSTP